VAKHAPTNAARPIASARSGLVVMASFTCPPEVVLQ
jgi:hypothetical protein